MALWNGYAQDIYLSFTWKQKCTFHVNFKFQLVFSVHQNWFFFIFAITWCSKSYNVLKQFTKFFYLLFHTFNLKFVKKKIWKYNDPPLFHLKNLWPSRVSEDAWSGCENEWAQSCILFQLILAVWTAISKWPRVKIMNINHMTNGKFHRGCP